VSAKFCCSFCVCLQGKSEDSSLDTADGSGGMLPASVAPPPHVSLGLTGQRLLQKLFSLFYL